MLALASNPDDEAAAATINRFMNADGQKHENSFALYTFQHRSNLNCYSYSRCRQPY